MDQALSRIPAGRPARETSFWLDAVAAAGDPLTRRPPLAGDTTADVCIVGAGLTGLWTAHSLLAIDPTLRIVVVEREFAGFGASGRNGGWCSALFPTAADAIAERWGADGASAMRRAMRDTVDAVGTAAAEAGIDCDFVKGGTLGYARSAPQLAAARAEVADAARWGDRVELREPAAGDAAGTLGVTWTPDCARLQPAKLVRGLAAHLASRGVVIAEGTTVIDWSDAAVTTDRGTVAAGAIVVATEGYTAGFRRTHRRVLPLYSLMIATEPLPASVWDAIGIAHGETFTDFRHLLIYGQRTADDRIAFGGRGARYHFGSAVKPEYDRVPRVFEHLRTALVDLFPVLESAAITHRWGGPLGVARDWSASVEWDGRVGRAGGYVGDGLSTTNLAGRTLAALITGADRPEARLPWVGHRSPDWEVEPLRFAGANAGMVALDLADREERRTGRPSLIAKAVAPLTGH